MNIFKPIGRAKDLVFLQQYLCSFLSFPLPPTNFSHHPQPEPFCTTPPHFFESSSTSPILPCSEGVLYSDSFVRPSAYSVRYPDPNHPRTLCPPGPPPHSPTGPNLHATRVPRPAHDPHSTRPGQPSHTPSGPPPLAAAVPRREPRNAACVGP